MQTRYEPRDCFPKIWLSRISQGHPSKQHSQREEEVRLSFPCSGRAHLDVSLRAPSGLLGRGSDQIDEQVLARLHRLLEQFLEEWDRCPPELNIP